jgi:hypothetical protein
MRDLELSTWERIEHLQDTARRIEDGWSMMDPGVLLGQIAAANHDLCYLATDAVEFAVQAGWTQRKIAMFLDVPESALRGARKELQR